MTRMTRMTRMSRRDYEMLARVIRDAIHFHESWSDDKGGFAIRRLTGHLADALAAANENFDKERFMAACLMTDLTQE